MHKILFSRKLTTKDHVKILKSLLIIVNAATLTLYLFLRILFYNTPISLNDDLVALFKTVLIGSLSAIAVSAVLVVIEIIDLILLQRKANLFPALKYASVAIFTMLVFYLAGCKAHFLTRIHKDGNTGMVTSYENLEPGNSLLLMNNEVLDHTDIPLGDNFVLINDDVKGLTEKDGRVSAGCKLVITDKQGKSILSEPDLFKGEDIFTKEKAKCLRCTISTGKPMNRDEDYDVAVTFWDKYGDGKIENKFSVRMVEQP
ncbi:MAG: hypothetical protein ABIN36_11390 [Ferruginibacter sp.]